MNRPAGPLSRISYLAYRQVRWLLGDKSASAATLKLTSRCNLRCRHCRWASDSPADLPTERWKELISTLGSRGVRDLVLEGGEPTLRQDLQDLVGWGHAQGMTVTVVTNGTRPLGAYAPDRFLISIDGLEDAHDRIRGQDSFQSLLRNLPTAKSPRIGLVSLHRGNAGQLQGILDFFASRLEGFYFSFIYAYRNGEDLALTTAQKKEAAAELLAARARYPIINQPSSLRRIGTSRPCRGWMLQTVTADGVLQSRCVIEAVEPGRCDECELTCYREASDFIDPRLYHEHLWRYIRNLAR